MPIDEGKIKPGRVYINENYCYVQILDIVDQTVTYRLRGGSSLGRFNKPQRAMALSVFAAWIRAEVNGEYLPHFADLRGYDFQRSDRERSALDRHLAERAALRPFVTC